MPKGICIVSLFRHALPVTPGDDEDFATRLADSCKLTDELGFIWHVLTALHWPDQVKLPISEWLVQRICYLIVYFLT
jgi:hypothetical protein